MKRDCVRPSAWGVASKGFFCVTVFGLSMQIGPALAQSGQSLPPVTVDAPKPQTARPTQPSRRAARSQRGTRRVAAPAQQQQQQTVDSGGRGAVGERAIGPVVGYLASQSATATKTDTPILTTPQSISVVTKDQVEDQGAQNLTEALRYTPGVTVAELWRQCVLRFVQAQGIRCSALSGWPKAAGGHHDLRHSAD